MKKIIYNFAIATTFILLLVGISAFMAGVVALLYSDIHIAYKLLTFILFCTALLLGASLEAKGGL